jgi:uncharacterized RDD family membrane protein YckC
MFVSRGALTTPKTVDAFGILNSFVDRRAGMHSAEPLEPRFTNDAGHQALEDEGWRAVVASRVNNYRARRKQGEGEEDSPNLDFGPAADATGYGGQGPAALNPGAESGAESYDALLRGARQGEEPRSPVHPSRATFDTNYYRRLNAESFAQIPGPLMGATAAATAPAQALEAECGVEDDVEEDVESGAEDEAMRAAAPGDASCAELLEEAGNELAIDLELRPTMAEDPCLDRYCISAAAPAPPPAALPPAIPQGNLIVFRRSVLEPPLLPQPSRDELAEPMNRRPRILEVPEDIMPAVQGSLFPEIHLDADEPESCKPREPEIEVPLQVAPVSARLMAALTDLGVVIAAGVLLGAIAWGALPEIPHTKPFWMMLGAATMLLWTIYQHLFLLYAGRTLGMSLRSIHLRTFDGRVPEWRQRHRRARFMFVSFAAAALGFLWALVDEDELCWHDRLSQTFPTTE